MLGNKKGNMLGMLLIIGALFLLMLVGVLLAFGTTITKFVFDTAVPELSGLGQMGDVNATHITSVAINPVNSFVQNLGWMTGLLYVFGIIGVLGLAYAFRGTGDKWLIGLFFGLVVILILASLFISNIYEGFSVGTDMMATGLQDQQLLSFLIIYSPAFMSFISFIAGIILFAGTGDNQGNY